jgi:signal transduction histidine kinase
MPLSRLRLQLAGWFALAFLAGLLLLSLTLFGYARRASDARLTHSLRTEASELAGAIQLESADSANHGVDGAARASLGEWPARPEAFAVYSLDGRRLGVTGPSELVDALPRTWPANGDTPIDLPGPGIPRRLVPYTSSKPGFRVVAAGTTSRFEAEVQSFVVWLVASVPVTVLLSLAAGYVLSRRALRPVADLERAIGEIGPDALDRRLPVRPAPDELDRLATRFNALLDELHRAQEHNRRFLERAAHQLRTPLTVVLGEAELALDRHTEEARGDALRRIRLAAGLMRRRVEELMLLARASAGERPPLTDTVELDGLAFECADLMRGRAQQLGRRLELARVEPVSVKGSEPLLREAVVELVENACRHGTARLPVALSAFRTGRQAVLEITNAAGPEAPPPEDPARQPLGLEVVHWIATEHGGQLSQHRSLDTVITTLAFPS